MKATKIKHERKSPVKVIPISFLLAILVGTGLLMLPFSTVPGEETDIITALFTATTSICVTGLVVVDTCSHWTLFGHIVILLLITNLLAKIAQIFVSTKGFGTKTCTNNKQEVIYPI